MTKQDQVDKDTGRFKQGKKGAEAAHGGAWQRRAKHSQWQFLEEVYNSSSGKGTNEQNHSKF